MREPLTLFEQSTKYKNVHRKKHLSFGRRMDHLPIDSMANNMDDNTIILKSRSVDVYTSKHLVKNGQLVLPYSGRQKLDELVLPAIARDINREENHRHRHRKRPTYRKSLFHQFPTHSSQVDLSLLTARGVKPDVQTSMSIFRDDDTVNNLQLHYAPPPSPSDDELERLIFELQETSSSPPRTQQSLEKDGYIPFRLPVLHRSKPNHYISTIEPSKDIRSTLSNYLHKFY